MLCKVSDYHFLVVCDKCGSGRITDKKGYFRLTSQDNHYCKECKVESYKKVIGDYRAIIGGNTYTNNKYKKSHIR